MLAQQIVAEGVNIRVETVGFQVDADAASELQCIAEATGAMFRPAESAEDLAREVRANFPTGTMRSLDVESQERRQEFSAGTDQKPIGGPVAFIRAPWSPVALAAHDLNDRARLLSTAHDHGRRLGSGGTRMTGTEDLAHRGAGAHLDCPFAEGRATRMAELLIGMAVTVGPRPSTGPRPRGPMLWRAGTATRSALFLVVGLVASACSLFGAEEEVAGTATPTPVAVATTDPGPTATPTDEPTADPTVEETEAEVDELGLAEGEYPSVQDLGRLGSGGTCQYLGAEWCEDANDNVWPDFAEAAVGYDPSVDSCLVGDCGGPGLADFDLARLQENTLFVLDASGSMAGDAGGGQTKMEAAKAALVEYVTVTPEFADLGLIVYGHQGDNSDAGRPASCAGIDTFAAVGDLTFENAQEVVGQFQPTGWTPHRGGA